MKQIEVDALKEKLDKIPARSIENADGRAYALIRLSTVFEIIKQMPPAQPKQRTGYFIGTEFDWYADGSPVYYEWKCSECGCVFEDDEPTYNYCPNCGAKMEDKGW